jgi:serine protease Do
MQQWKDFGWGPEGNREDLFEWRGGPDGKNGKPSGGKPRLGIKAQDREDANGVDVLEVEPSSAAEKAGMKKGDIILSFDGKEVKGADELANAANAASKKESVSIELSRNGKKQKVEIKTPRKLKTAQL